MDLSVGQLIGIIVGGIGGLISLQIALSCWTVRELLGVRERLASIEATCKNRKVCVNAYP